MQTNNKCREALEIAKKAICNHARTSHICDSLAWENSTINANCGDILCSCRDLCEAKTAIQKALAVPPRNCDVGTAEEQEKRFKENCGYGIPRCLSGCKVFKFALSKGLVGYGGEVKVGCEFLWAQMPYEKGATDEQK